MKDPVIYDMVRLLRSEVSRLRALDEQHAAPDQGPSPASRNDNSLSTWKKIKRIGNIPRDCSRFVRRHVRQWFTPNANGCTHANSSSFWKKIKRIGNIPRDCSRFMRRHVRQWYGSIAKWMTHKHLASLASLWKLQEGLRRLDQAQTTSFELQEARHSEIVSRCLKMVNDCHTIRSQLMVQSNRCQNLEGSITVLQHQLLNHEARIPQATKKFRQNVGKREVTSDESKRRMDALYIAFEDRFRGTQEDIKERVRVYLPFLRDSGLAKVDMPVFDVGCGRGEWLELLQEHGFLARGIDSNQEMVRRCRERGLDVTEGDAVAMLHDFPDASLGAVTAFHVIEHLPLDTLLELLRETLRVLKPGGLAIFETPNPENIQVGSCTFYFDPTHRNPLPWPLTQFLVDANGFCRTQILKLHPRDLDFNFSNSELVEKFSDLFYGPQDYAVIGWKAADATSTASICSPQTAK